MKVSKLRSGDGIILKGPGIDAEAVIVVLGIDDGTVRIGVRAEQSITITNQLRDERSRVKRLFADSTNM